MKVLMQSRTTLFSVPGGDTVQLMQTADALRRKGVKVDISSGLEPDLQGYDIVHLFNFMRPQETWIQCRNAKKQGKKVLLSTIFGEYDEFEKKTRKGISGVLIRNLRRSHIEYVKVAGRAAMNYEMHKGVMHLLMRGYGRLQSDLLEMVEWCLPNSYGEMKRMIRYFPRASHIPFTVVPNAVDPALFSPGLPLHPSAGMPEEEFVLCVGRVELRKNQLNVVRAMRNLPWSLVLIGKPAPNHIHYFNQVLAEGGSRMKYKGWVDQADLPFWYQKAKVHILASWMETPGLSSLEAGAMGCNLVITEKGDTVEYFRDEAFYCLPDSVESIRKAIVQAFEAPRQRDLQSRILTEYTWEKAAEATFSAYEAVQAKERK
ncbi:MAG: glycosyltransferase [Candidatus Ratteibacteria bacterium]|jgi:glycosyltransferase involved in cell wall biosynthesis